MAGELYLRLQTTLRQFRRGGRKRADQGLLQMFLRKVTGDSGAYKPGTLFSATGYG